MSTESTQPSLFYADRDDRQHDYSRFPEAIGIICLDPSTHFMPKFLQECLWRETHEVSVRHAISTESELVTNAATINDIVANNDSLYVSSSATVLSLITQKYQFDENSELKTLTAPGNVYANSISVELDDGSDDSMYTDVNAAFYLIPAPEWANCTINISVNPGISVHSPDVLVTFRIQGDRVYGDGFTASVEAWWKRMMIAYDVDNAVCRISDNKNSRVLTEKDMDKEFMIHIPMPDNYYSM